jgi:hypothetical protein
LRAWDASDDLPDGDAGRCQVHLHIIHYRVKVGTITRTMSGHDEWTALATSVNQGSSGISH